MDTQIQRTYKYLKAAGSRGVLNHEFATRGLLRYSHFIKKLRDDYDCHITAERLKINGRWSGTWVYRLEDDDKE